MPQREWEKSKMKIKTSEGILKKEKMSQNYESSFDYNDRGLYKTKITRIGINGRDQATSRNKMAITHKCLLLLYTGHLYAR